MTSLLVRITRGVFYALNASGPLVTDSKGRTLRLANTGDLADEKLKAQYARCEEIARTIAAQVLEEAAEELERTNPLTGPAYAGIVRAMVSAL